MRRTAAAAVRRFVWIAWIACALLLLARPGEARAERNLQGTWRGTIDAGGVKLRLVLTLARSGEAGYSGILDSLDQGASIPVDKISVGADRVVLDVAKVSGSYDGMLSQDDTRMTGTWKQPGVSYPLVFEKDKKGAAAGDNAAPAPRRDDLRGRFPAPLELDVPIAPTLFSSNGKRYLAYELHVTNFGGEDVSLKRVEVLDASVHRSLAGRADLELATDVYRPGSSDLAGLDRLRLGPGLRAVLFLWVVLDDSAPPPPAVEHRITAVAGDRPEETTAPLARVPVRTDLAILAAPLRGGRWLAGNGPSNVSSHRRSLIPVAGRARIAQRFAIDWVRVNRDGKTFAGDAAKNRSYRAYRAEVLAVADGTVVAVKDGIRENVPGLTSRAVSITLDTVAGNHVVLDIGEGRFALYAHLVPGSLRTKQGDRVRRGQVLGLVGNSGNSTEPHLHFHLADSPSPLGSEGIPYVFTSYQTDPGKAGGGPRLHLHRNELPLENEVVTFAD